MASKTYSRKKTNWKKPKTISERFFLMKNCFKIIFNSNWSKRRFLKGMKNDFVNSEKLVVINQSAKKNNVKITI